MDNTYSSIPLERRKKVRIACIGNIVYDLTVFLDFHFLTRGAKHTFTNFNFNTGGPASTAASVIAKGNHQVDFYGQIGKDGFGDIVYNEMVAEKINLKHVNITNEVMTPFGFIIVSNDGERTICSIRSPKDLKNPTIGNIEYENNYDFILTDGKYPDESINLIKANPNAISVIDAGRANEGVKKVCREVDYIICSEEFANKITGLKIGYDYKTLEKIYDTLKQEYKKAKGIVITIGKRGYIYEKDNRIILKPAYEPEGKTIDTNGAGDIYHGAFVHAMANGFNYDDSLEFANITAAISTTQHGGRKSCPDLDMVEDKLNTLKLTRRK